MEEILQSAQEARDFVPGSYAEEAALGAEQNQENIDKVIGGEHPGLEPDPAVQSHPGPAAAGGVRAALRRHHPSQRVHQRGGRAGQDLRRQGRRLLRQRGCWPLWPRPTAPPGRTAVNERCLGIDTSNYTTSAGVFQGGRVVRNEKMLLPVKPGERGLRQSDAVFHHVRQLPQVLEPALSLGPAQAIGVSVTPHHGGGLLHALLSGGKGLRPLPGAGLGGAGGGVLPPAGAPGGGAVLRRAAGPAGAALFGLSRVRGHHRGLAGGARPRRHPPCPEGRRGPWI